VLAIFGPEENCKKPSARNLGHNDPAEEKALVETIKAREDLSAALVDKILVRNPKEFYSL